VQSQNQTAILESGQQQGVRTAAGDQTDELVSVSLEIHRDCGPEAEVNACKVFNIHGDKYTQIQQIFCRVNVEVNTIVWGTCIPLLSRPYARNDIKSLLFIYSDFREL
jgi:hypothetical protein